MTSRRENSFTVHTPTKDMRVKVVGEQGDGLAMEAFDHTQGRVEEFNPTHWGFGQLAVYAQAPASYLRRIPAELAAINLQWGLENNPTREDTVLMGYRNGATKLRAMTSASYGRIWDEQVIEAVQRVNINGNWKVPYATYQDSDPLRATTLYASDRDVFVFLVDDQNPITIGDETLFRGFFAWNSEVGSATFGLTTFLYRTVCDNRMVWGADNIRELRIRHNAGAPDRFAYEGAKYLDQYANASSSKIVDAISKAKEFELPASSTDEEDSNTWSKWLQNRGFTAKQARDAVDTAREEEGEARNLWDIINGITASARRIKHTDDRVKLETAAGRLMDQVAR